MKKVDFLCFVMTLSITAGVLNMPALAQGETKSAVIYRIVTTDRNTFIGTLVSENDQEVILQTNQVGRITIQRSNIKMMEQVDPDQLKDGKYWHENPQSTRYLISTNAFGLRKGEGYYQNTWIFFNNVNFGVTDHISLGGGLVPTFLFGSGSMPVWIMPKISIPIANESVHIAAGGLFGGVLGEVHTGLGLVYGTATVGNRDNNLSLGLGYGYADGRWADIPLINVKGMYRLSKNMFLSARTIL
ncbi:MAG: hypothetical protein MK198_10285 [Gracilimonas sp.]|uniref:hypothetical protein n=1 Tax=Gracilimonas sp. TaxID=1974203 RepID=UPI0037520970|nr:hypothetical protein [Gracilimonas sp.]